MTRHDVLALVTKLNRPALVGFDLRQMEGDVSVELLEEWDPIADQDRQSSPPAFFSRLLKTPPGVAWPFEPVLTLERPIRMPLR